MKVIQVKPWGDDQGDFVEINEEDFDPKVHELLGESKPAKAPKGKPEDVKASE